MTTSTKRLIQSILFLSYTFSAHSLFALTINEIVNPKGVTYVALSPDGKHLAAIASTGENHGVIVIDADTMKSDLIDQGKWTNAGDIRYRKEPRKVFWVANDMLAIDYGAYSVTLTIDGKFVADIGDDLIEKINPDQPGSPMLLIRNDYRKSNLSVVNATNGEITKLSLPGSGSSRKLVFDGKGQLRAATMYNSAIWEDITVVENWYRPSANDPWVKLAEFKLTDNFWIPVGIPDQANTLIISSNLGRDTDAIFKYDTSKREIGEMMAGHPTQDIVNVKGIDGDVFKSVETGGMMPDHYWFDAAWDKIQRSVDAALPGRINDISGDLKNRILIFSHSDVDPGRWFILTIATMRLSLVAEAKPQIDPKKMHHMEIVSYPARDGLVIPAYLTKPANASGMQPAIIVVHGGPTVRDYWKWDPEVQMLADRGYVVFQPQFRGTSGFGMKFQEAGYGQWGKLMQDDITDGVEYLVKKGIVDPHRICIYGASYGGYAALWGLEKTPDLYKCGISFAGVSDIGNMFHDSSDRTQNQIAREIMRTRIGNSDMSQEQFDSVSPLLHAEKIKAPLLLMHGEKDNRVPISHSRKMKNALDDNHKMYEWIEFPREAHGFTYVADQFKFYSSTMKFLYKYNPPDPTPENNMAQENETLDIKADVLRNVVTY